MEAPDKVYIDDLAVVNDCITKISLKQLPNFSEYIRKDTLLEKLNEIKKYGVTIYGKTLEELDHFNFGRRDALDGVIKLLNSM